MTEPQKLPLHVRAIRAEAWKVSETELDVTGHLVDDRPQGVPAWFDPTPASTIHDMRLTIRVRYPDLVITRASGSMATHPYTLCPDALPPLELDDQVAPGGVPGDHADNGLLVAHDVHQHAV